MIIEEWRTVPSRDGYEASSLGRIRTVATGTIRVGRLESNGYRKICLGKSDWRWVHRLICEAFRGEAPSRAQVRHLDGDSLNNCADNLTWGDQSANEFDKVRHGTHQQARKTHCKRGHAFVPENTLPNGTPNSRSCRACRDARNARRRSRAAA